MTISLTSRVNPVLLVALVFVTTANAQSQWQTLEPNGRPRARYEVCAAEVNGLIYVLGDRKGNQAVEPLPVDRFDPEANTWVSLGRPPVFFHHVRYSSFTLLSIALAQINRTVNRFFFERYLT